MDSDILYLIIFIAISVLGSMRKKNKKSATPKRKVPDIFGEEIFEEIKRNFQQEEPESVPDTNSRAEEVITDPYYDESPEPAFSREEPEYVNYDEQYENSDDTEALSYEEINARQQAIFKKKQEAHRMMAKLRDLPEIEEAEDSEYHFEFDPVNAVIYSEILRRPEY